jgi:hypothetical protein
MQLVLSLLLAALVLLPAASVQAAAPYPASTVVTGITWDTGTYKYGGLGGDIWPVTWASDSSLRAAWGDGKLGCSVKVSYGMAVLSGSPNANLTTTACGPSGTGHGKIYSLLDISGRLYAVANLENRTYGDFAVWSSSNRGTTWQKPGWVFLGSEGTMRAISFVNFGKAYADARDGYVYLLGTIAAPTDQATTIYLLRVLPANLQRGLSSYSYFSGTAAAPAWSANVVNARPIFSDPNGVRRPELTHVAGLDRYLLTVAHYGPGQLGIFEALHPWGAWRTVSYQENWLGMASTGTATGGFQGLRFPSKWVTDGGRTLWGVFSCYNTTNPDACGKDGKYHDRFNLIRARLTLAAPAPTASD